MPIIPKARASHGEDTHSTKLAAGGETNCRICGSPRRREIDREIQGGQTYTILQCKDCSMIYIREVYSLVSPEYLGLQDPDINADLIWRQSEHKRKAHEQCLRLFKQTHAGNAAGGKPTLLDVGCGTGGFLRAAHSSFECYGFDASPGQARYAGKSFPHIRRATSCGEYGEQFDSPLPAFDFVTLWDVLEHIRNPREFLVDLTGALAPNGLLFISVPGAKAMRIKSSLLARGWPRARFSWNPREHVNYFTPDSLRLLLGKSHLRAVRIGTVPVYPRPFSLFEIIRRLGFSTLKIFPDWAPQFYVLAEKTPAAPTIGIKQ